jgi:hypothetical protein
MLGVGSGESLVGVGEVLNALGLGGCICDVGPMISLSGPGDVGPPPPPPEAAGVGLDGPGVGGLAALNAGDPLVTGGSEVGDGRPLGGTTDGTRLPLGVSEFSETIGPGLEVAGRLVPEVGDGLAVVDGLGLAVDADPAENTDGGDPDGGTALDGTVVDETGAGDPGLGWPDTLDAGLLAVAEVGDPLVPDRSIS